MKVVNVVDAVMKCNEICDLYVFLEQGTLSTDEATAKRCVLESSHFTLLDGVLYHCNKARGGILFVVVPQVLRHVLLKELHVGCFGGHFAAKGLHIYMQLCLRGTGGKECAPMPIDSVEDA